MKKNILWLISLIIVLSHSALLSQAWNSQSLNVPIATPEGDEVIGQVTLPPSLYNSYSGAFTYYLTKDGIFGKATNGVLIALPGTYYKDEEIIGYYIYKGKLFVASNDVNGKTTVDVYVSESSNSITNLKSFKVSQSNITGRILEIKGDAVYTITNSLCYVSRDSLATWQVDTTGLNGAVITSFDLDSAQYVYSVTTKGLFKQSPNSNTWIRVNSFPLQSYLTKIFIDRSQRIYVTSGADIYYSTDNGSTWLTNNSGLDYLLINGFGEDSYKNIYLLVGNKVYKSAGGTNAWLRIDKPVSDLFLDADTNAYLSSFNCIGGDSTLYLCSHYGLFQSTDQGTSWSAFNQGISANNIFGFAKSSSRSFASTNLGLFYTDQNNAAWVKAFPSNGYTTGNVIFAFQNGNIYTLGANENLSNYYSPSTVWKSLDNGNTWNADTAGISAFSNGITPQYFVDENQVQHLMVSNSNAVLYKKSPSDSKWLPDTSGLGSGSSISWPAFCASDNHGFLYASFVDYTQSPSPGIIFKRPITGGTWIADTLGLNGHQAWSLSADSAGNIVVGTIDDGVYLKINNKWTPLPAPSGLGGDAAFVTTFDKYGALYAGFSNYDWNNYNYVWHGVYGTIDKGKNWTLLGLDSVAVRNLAIIGDTLYAVTYYKGIFKMPVQKVTNVTNTLSKIPTSIELFQNYPNPFNPSTIISYSIRKEGIVTLKVFDVLSREVKTLVNKYQTTGKYSANFNASNFSSGVYFYQLKVGSFVETKKLILLK